MVKFGAARVKSDRFCGWARSIWSSPMAVTDTGTSCSDSSRRWAVTTTASTSVCARVGPVVACALAGPAPAQAALAMTAALRNHFRSIRILPP